MGWGRQWMGAAGWRGCAVDVGGAAACAWLHGRGARTAVWWPQRVCRGVGGGPGSGCAELEFWLWGYV